VSLHWPSRRKPEPLTRYVGDHTDKLSRVQPMVHDPDERPSGEDLTYGETVFNRAPVPLPRFLLPKSKRLPRKPR